MGLGERLIASHYKTSHVLKPEEQEAKAQYWAVAPYATT